MNFNVILAAESYKKTWELKLKPGYGRINDFHLVTSTILKINSTMRLV
jgi:hypothetical protein